MKRRIISLCIAIGLLFSVVPQFVLPAKATTDSQEEVYLNFMKYNGYESYINKELGMEDPSYYTIVDINQDGISELLIKASDGWMGFCTIYLFTLDATGENVAYVTWIYTYGGVSYSSEYKSLVYCYPRPTAMEGSTGFYKFTGSGLTISFSVEYENYNNYYLTKYDQYGYKLSRKAIDESEYKEYLATESTMEWSKLPEISGSLMYRIYNPNSGEHFYTANAKEKDYLVSLGWKYEGVAWYAPASGDAVYRMYNPNSGDHHYTAYWEEVKMLQSYGWRYEGIGWYSAGKTGVPMYRMWNPNADCGSHHYTSSAEERDWLKALGWKYEGIGWYGLDVN